MEQECSADKSLYEAYLVYKEARDTLNQVRRGRGFWPVIAIPAPDDRSATLAVRNTDESFRGKGKDGKSTTHKGKSKGRKSGKTVKNKGGKGKSSGKSSVKGKGDPLEQRLVSQTQCRLCGEESHWEEDCPQADVGMPQAKRRVTFSRPPVGTGVSQAWCVETWTVAPSAENAESRLKTWTSQEIQESSDLMGVTMTMPEGHAILDCGAALDCIGEVAAARTAQAITASGETRRPAVVDKIQRFKFGGDGDPVEASFAVTSPVHIGDAKTWIEAFVVPGSTPHLFSRRWLSQHRCVVNFDPTNLCLESPEFGSVPLVLHSSGHLLLSLVSPSKPVDQYTVMIDYQNSPSSVVNNFQKCNEQIMDSLQSRNQVVDKRAEPDEKRAGNSTLVRRKSDHPVEFAVHLDDPNEEITEQWQDGLHEWYIRRDDQCSVKPNRIPRDVSEMRSSKSLCPCLKRRSVSGSTNSKVSTPRERDSHSA